MAKKKNTTAGLQLNMFAGVNTTAALNAQIADIEKKITALYGSTYKFAAQIAQVRAAVAAGQEFSFADNQAAAKQIEQRLAAIATTLDQQLGKATERSFALGQASTEHALTNALGTDKATKKEVESITEDAAAAMRKRGADGHTYYTQKRGGVSISDRVWNITESAKLEIEIAIQQAALEGKSPDELARTIQQNLNHPERLFRSVRVKDPTTGEWTGEYRMSKAAKNCHPGQGVYRSAYKNALRLARTELTQAYRRAEWETYQDNPLVTGYRIELSNNHTTTIITRHGKQIKPLHDICDEMQGTQYPKTFLWTGWHPQCRCRMIPITISKDDFKERVKARHRGKLDEWQPKEQTTEMPKAFTDWVEANKHRWAQKGHVAPFFIRDNYQQGDVAKGLDTRITSELEAARLASQQAAARTEEERRKAEEAAKAAATPQPITDYDSEVESLRRTAQTYNLDLAKMEQLRAEGRDMTALRAEIDRLNQEREKKQDKWDKEINKAQREINKLLKAIKELENNGGDGSVILVFNLRADVFVSEVQDERRAKDMETSLIRIAKLLVRIKGVVQEVNKRIKKTAKAKQQNTPDIVAIDYFKKNGYDVSGEKMAIEKGCLLLTSNMHQYLVDIENTPENIYQYIRGGTAIINGTVEETGYIQTSNSIKINGILRDVENDGDNAITEDDINSMAAKMKLKKAEDYICDCKITLFI